MTQSHTLEELVHLHALNFPLSAALLPQLSSLELALTRFHFDTDDALTLAARQLFLSRRAQALLHPGKVSALPARPVPRAYQGLVDCLRASAQRGITQPLRSQVGGEIKKYDELVYEREAGPRTWRELAQEASQKGIVVLSSVHLPSREWIALAPEVSPGHFSCAG